MALGLVSLVTLSCVAAGDRQPTRKRGGPDPIPQGDVFGLGAAMAREEARWDKATPKDLAARTPAFATSVPSVKDAKYLDRILKPKSHGVPRDDFALDAAERAALDENGFVVSLRLGARSHAGLMHTIYEHDQPLFVSADAILHAWHMGYDAMLEELESTWISGALADVLAGMAAEVKTAAARASALSNSVKDADTFIAVGRSLLAGTLVAPSLGDTREVERLLAAIAAKAVADVKLFGRERKEDFSQMRPRGHYEKSEPLRRYFRAMMWLGRTELAVAGPSATSRELAAAVVLQDLLVSSARLETWRQIDSLIQTFVGRSDSMGPADVGALLANAGFATARDVTNAADLAKLRQLVVDTKLGAQQINAQIRDSDPDRAARVELPRAYQFMGQRFTIDSWVLGQQVFDRIVVDGRKVRRTMPSGLDVAFAALGNDSVADLIAARIERGGQDGRDGHPFQKNLLAAREVVDKRAASAWDGTLYDVWLSALRGLSEATVDDRFPSVMRTRAWSRRLVNTQLASWAELRHDTILYVEQPMTEGISCEYPAGFVELAPAFWARMELGAKLARELVEKTSFPSTLKRIKEKEVAWIAHFGDTVSTLRGIADKELRSTPLSAAEEMFLKQAVEVAQKVCGQPPRWDGWYIKLFYSWSDATKFDALVADVHTSPSGGSLHVGTGVAALMVVVIDRGGDTMAFAGPVSTYYEHVPRDGRRLTDVEWKKSIVESTNAPPPEWTAGWLLNGRLRFLSMEDD